MSPTADDEFQRFFTDHYTDVCRALLLALGSAGDAEDAAQEAFARAFDKWRSVRGMDRPATWVYVVAIREAWRQQRRRQRIQALLLRKSDEPDPTSNVDSRLTLHTALAELPARQRMAVVLRYYADLPIADIAKVMQCREGTVKATLHNAVGRLRKLTMDTTGADDV